MELTRFQLKIIKYAVQDKLEIKQKAYEYWMNYSGTDISPQEKHIVLVDIENDIKDFEHIISEVSNAICKES